MFDRRDLLVAAGILVAAACTEPLDTEEDDPGTGTGTGTEPACPDVSGVWAVTGTCLVSECVISQSGCSLSFECDTGTFDGTVTSAGVSFQATMEVCEGTFEGTNTIAGSCADAGAVTCTFTATN